jgi:hypothetical protein
MTAGLEGLLQPPELRRLHTAGIDLAENGADDAHIVLPETVSRFAEFA